jgi:UDP-2,4-diacetamido-2,4,6-trideoxy-beta-L-altropyranose hydrolase
MNREFIIRTTQGNEIGFGHFYRCLSLASKLIASGYDVKFILNNNETKDILKKLKIPFRELKDVNEEECLMKCKKIVNNKTILIVDLPFHNEVYSKEFQNICDTVIIDDLGNKSIFSEFLLNGSIVKDYHKYKIENINSKLFLGSDYMIIREEFLENRNLVNISQNPIKKILVTFGGNDDLGLSFKIAPILANMSYEITVILGQNSQKNENYEKIKNFNNIKIKKIVNNMASEMIKYDLIISAAGITSYELASLGIPTIFIPTGKFQIPTANEMQKKGFGINYGVWDDDHIKFQNVIRKIDSYENREKMYENGRRIVDGKGVERVVNLLVTHEKISNR